MTHLEALQLDHTDDHNKALSLQGPELAPYPKEVRNLLQVHATRVKHILHSIEYRALRNGRASYTPFS